MPILRWHSLTILFSFNIRGTLRRVKQKMTEATPQKRAEPAMLVVQSFPLFCFAQMPKDFEYISNSTAS